MLMQGLSSLVTAIMAAGDVAMLDARDPRLAHRAVVDLDRTGTPGAKAVLRRFAVEIKAKPDPEVGLRVSGLTRATWDAVVQGSLAPVEEGYRAWYILLECERTRLQHMIHQLPAGEAECLYRVGAAWALDSTDRKNRPSEALLASI